MCDGSIKTISQEIDYGIYVRLMTTDSRKISPVTDPPAPGGFIKSTGPVSDQELEL